MKTYRDQTINEKINGKRARSIFLIAQALLLLNSNKGGVNYINAL